MWRNVAGTWKQQQERRSLHNARTNQKEEGGGCSSLSRWMELFENYKLGNSTEYPTNGIIRGRLTMPRATVVKPPPQ